MKNHFLLSFILSLFVLTACSDDDNTQSQNEEFFKQGWQLYSMHRNGTEVDISGIPLPELMYFGDQNVCYLATPTNKEGSWTYTDVRTAWNYDYSNQILNIAARLPVTGNVETITENQLILRYNAFNSMGIVNTYVKEYRSANVKIENLTIRLDQ